MRLTCTVNGVVRDRFDAWDMPRLLLSARRTLPNSFFIPSACARPNASPA